MLCLIELLSLLLSRKDKKEHFNVFPFPFTHSHTVNTHLAGISGRELRAPASGTQTSSYAVVSFDSAGDPRAALTFVGSMDHRLVCVVLQAAVPVDEVHHVLRHGDGGDVDGEALTGREKG